MYILFLVPSQYGTSFNATQYEYCVDANAPVGSVVFTATLFVEPMPYTRTFISFAGDLAQFLPFVINGSGYSITYESRGNDNSIPVHITVNGTIDTDRTYVFQLTALLQRFETFYQNESDVIIYSKCKKHCTAVYEIPVSVF